MSSEDRPGATRKVGESPRVGGECAECGEELDAAGLEPLVPRKWVAVRADSTVEVMKCNWVGGGVGCLSGLAGNLDSGGLC